MNQLTDEQRAINAAGIATCRAAIAGVTTVKHVDEPERPLTPSELIHQRALERAQGERRNHILDRIGAAA